MVRLSFVFLNVYTYKFRKINTNFAKLDHAVFDLSLFLYFYQ